MTNFKIFLISFVFLQNLVAQTSSRHEVVRFFPGLFGLQNKPVDSSKYEYLVEGTPFFKETWQLANLTLNGGARCNNISVKLNLIDNEVHFIDSTGAALVAITPINIIAFKNDITNDSSLFYYYSVFGTNALNKKMEWLQILNKGKYVLVKGVDKQMTESLPYAASKPEQKIYTENFYGVWKENRMNWLVKFKDIISLFTENSAKIEAFIKVNSLKGKAEKDYVAVMNFIETL